MGFLWSHIQHVETYAITKNFPNTACASLHNFQSILAALKGHF